MLDKDYIIEKMKDQDIYDLKNTFVKILKKRIILLEEKKASRKEYHDLKSFFNMIGLYDIADVCENLEENFNEEYNNNVISVLKELIEILS